MTLRLMSVHEFAKAHGFTEPTVRGWLQMRNQNGFAKAGASVKIGARVYIDVDGFERWVNEQQPNGKK